MLFSALRSKILFPSSQSILEFDVDQANVIVLVGHGGTVVHSIDYDNENRYVYFTRTAFFDIVR